MSAGRALVATVVLLLLPVRTLASPAGEVSPGYVHNRHDYAAFHARHPQLLEPNYLPFMATPVTLEEGGAFGRPWRRLLRRLGLAAAAPELLVFCRWADDAFPLRVHVTPPALPAEEAEVQQPPSPQEYVAAVERALALWEEGLEGRVRFARAADPADAVLRIELRGEQAPLPHPDVQVLGTTPLGDACRVVGGAAQDSVLEVRFRVPVLRVYVADQHGLLLADQVEAVALHEIGHALGMRGHSPIPADLMFRVARDRLPRDELGSQDVHSFASLYSIPNGSVYARIPAQAAPPPEPPVPGEPRLAAAPHVDARLGFEVQLPEGWTSLGMPQGVVAVDGTTWDYDASLQILVRAYPSIDAYLRRHADGHLSGARLLEQRELELAGYPALRLVLERTQTGFVEELTLVEPGDGRVVVVIAECAAPLLARFRPWFEAVLATLDLGSGAGRDRDYETDRPPAPPGDGARP